MTDLIENEQHKNTLIGCYVKNENEGVVVMLKKYCLTYGNRGIVASKPHNADYVVCKSNPGKLNKIRGISMEMEYVTLRDEILQLMQKRDDYTRFAYTVIAAIWTAAFAIENAYVVLLGMFILIPIAIRVTDILYSSGNIAAYLSVFVESKIEAKWETLNYQYRKEYKRQNKTMFRYVSARSDFVMLQVINTLIFWFYRKTPPFDNLLLDHVIVLVQLLIVLFTCYQCHRSAVADIKREENIKNWQKIKSRMEGKEK